MRKRYSSTEEQAYIFNSANCLRAMTMAAVSMLAFPQSGTAQNYDAEAYGDVRLFAPVNAENDRRNCIRTSSRRHDTVRITFRFYNRCEEDLNYLVYWGGDFPIQRSARRGSGSAETGENFAVFEHSVIVYRMDILVCEAPLKPYANRSNSSFQCR